MRDGLPVHFFSMSHFYDQDDAVIIIDGVNHSIVALADAVSFFNLSLRVSFCIPFTAEGLMRN